MPSTDHPDSGGAAGTTTTATDENSTSPTSNSPLPPSSSAPADTTPSHPEHNTVTESNTESKPSAPAADGETPAAADAPSTEDVTQTPEEQKDAAAEKASEGEEENPDAELEESGSTLTITLLLITGARHPFKIDGKYLRKRSVNVDNYDPFAMSVYTLKELIWREWRSGVFYAVYLSELSANERPDWETRPASPSSIRLISFGKLLDDKSPLSGTLALFEGGQC